MLSSGCLTRVLFALITILFLLLLFLGLAGPALTQEAGLVLTKTASPETATVGQSLTFTMVETNNNPSFSLPGVVTDRLPVGVKLVSVTPSQGRCFTSDDSSLFPTGFVFCFLGNLSSGQSGTVTIVVTPTAQEYMTNTAHDNLGFGNSARATVTVLSAPSTPRATSTPQRNPLPTPGGKDR